MSFYYGNLLLNDISEYNNEIQELKVALRKTKNVLKHKRYAVCNYVKNYKLNGLAGLEIKHI